MMDLNGWIPYKLLLEEQVLFRWMYTGGKRYTEPFFEDTLLQCKSFACNSTPYRSLSSAESLIEATALYTAISPAAFIFHVSRCGSTLLSQLLSCSEENIVLSEVPLLDQVLRARLRTDLFTAPLREALYKSIVHILSHPKHGQERHCFVKLDSWHLFFHKELRSYYPYTPFILLYREPGEVIRSHAKRRGTQMVPGLVEPALAGLDEAEVADISQDEYMAMMLRRLYESMLDMAREDRYVLLLNYEERGMTLIERIAKHLQISPDNWDVEKMQARSIYHSKYPQQHFEEETSAALSLPDLSILRMLYHRLEEHRRRQDLY